MKYDLILDTKILKTKEFTGTPPNLSQNKGKWLERVEVTTEKKPTNLQKIKINHVITETQSKYEQAIIDKFEDTEDKTKAEQETEYLNQLIIDNRLRIQTENREECKSLIYDKYNQEFQNNIGLGLIPEATSLIATTYIFNMREEENRVFDLLEVSDDPESVVSPTWPEV